MAGLSQEHRRRSEYAEDEVVNRVGRGAADAAMWWAEKEQKRYKNDSIGKDKNKSKQKSNWHIVKNENIL